MRKFSKTDSHKKVIGFTVRENECIWMKAGIVNFRVCDNAYNCNECNFDKAMQKAIESSGNSELSWKTKLGHTANPDSQTCRHVLTGRIDAPKICTNNYQCNHCDFDQWLDEFDVQMVAGPKFNNVSGYQVACDYYYHMGHTWTRVENGGYTRLGFDDFLVKMFGASEKIYLPRIGDLIHQNQSCILFTREGQEAKVLAPVSGTILAVNHKAIDFPDLVHQDPYCNGWLLLVEPKGLKRNLSKLYFGTESNEWFEQEILRLLELLGPEYRHLAASGAQALDDFFGHYPEVGWQTLVRSFLKT